MGTRPMPAALRGQGRAGQDTAWKGTRWRCAGVYRKAWLGISCLWPIVGPYHHRAIFVVLLAGTNSRVPLSWLQRLLCVDSSTLGARISCFLGAFLLIDSTARDSAAQDSSWLL